MSELEAALDIVATETPNFVLIGKSSDGITTIITGGGDPKKLVELVKEWLKDHGE